MAQNQTPATSAPNPNSTPTPAQGLDPSSVVPLNAQTPTGTGSQTGNQNVSNTPGLDPNSVVPIDGGTPEALKNSLGTDKSYLQQYTEHPIRMDPAVQMLTGAAKGVGETAHTLGRVANLVTGDNIPGLPTSLEEPGYLQSSNIAQSTGKVGEGIVEFILGDEALKGVNIAEKLGIAQKVTALAEKYPTVAKILNLGMTAARQGTVTSGTALAHGATPGEAALSGVGGAGGSFVIGAAGQLAGSIAKAAREAKLNPQELQEPFQKGLKTLIDQVTDEEGVAKSKSKNIREYATQAGQNLEDKAVDLLQEVDKAAKEPFIQKFQQRLSNIQRAIRDLPEASGGPEEAKLLAQEQEVIEDMTQAYDEAAKTLKTPKEQVTKGLALFKKAQAMKDLGNELQRPSVTKGLQPDFGTAEQYAKNPETVKPARLFDRLQIMRNRGRLQQALGDDRAINMLLHASDYDAAERDIARRQLEAEAQMREARRVAATGAGVLGAEALGGFGMYELGKLGAGSMIRSVTGQ